MIPDEIFGYCMNAFYGGRVECRIRRELVPVTYLDVRSMYPTVFTLLRLQRFLIAERIEHEDATDEIRDLVDGMRLDRLYDQRTWPLLCAICEIEPDGGDILPVRAKYGIEGGRSIGVNHLKSDFPLWYSLPDVIASAILTGKPPPIRRAIRFAATGTLPDLRPVSLHGEVEIDPAREEIFRRVIEERERVKTDPAVPPAAAEARGRFLKTFANSAAYGIFAERNRQEPGSRPKKVTVFSDHQFDSRISAVELPGPYCFPPLATLITGASRLVLAMLERETLDRGGAYAFCDTDSMAVVTDYSAWEGEDSGRGLSDRFDALSLDQVSNIVEQFQALSPYAIPGSILKVEDENFADDSRRVRTPLYAFVVSAKRYVLLNFQSSGAHYVRRLSEHGLGTYVDPGNGSGTWLEE